jgi:hypothetical protein
MNQLGKYLVAGAFGLAASVSSAATVDFVARINNIDMEDASVLRVVSVVVIDEVSQPGRGDTFTVGFTVTDVNAGTVMFTGNATITTSQTQVTVGNANTGRIDLTYDPAIDRLEARFVIKGTSSNRYRVSANAYGGSWIGNAEVSYQLPL